MKSLLKSLIKEVLVTESRNEYVVRGGSEILTRMDSETPRDWKWETFPKVLYFSKEELVKKPRGPQDHQNYVFKRDGKLYAVDSRRLYLQPDV